MQAKVNIMHSYRRDMNAGDDETLVSLAEKCDGLKLSMLNECFFETCLFSEIFATIRDRFCFVIFSHWLPEMDRFAFLFISVFCSCKNEMQPPFAGVHLSDTQIAG